jgi:hypothetical protein
VFNRDGTVKKAAIEQILKQNANKRKKKKSAEGGIGKGRTAKNEAILHSSVFICLFLLKLPIFF